MPCHAKVRLGLLCSQDANDRLLWQNVQLTPSAFDIVIMRP